MGARRTTWFLALALSGCGGGYVAEIGGREPYEPPPVYAAWWTETERCSGRAGSFAALEWYLADWITGDTKVARGRWSAPHDIVIVRGYEADEAVVRHEMLHDLLRGDPGHASAEWTRCALLPR